eukprot:1822983-Prorocentrum_lima.AAC.1
MGPKDLVKGRVAWLGLQTKQLGILILYSFYGYVQSVKNTVTCFEHVQEHSQTHDSPFVAMGDFNMIPRLAASYWADWA